MIQALVDFFGYFFSFSSPTYFPLQYIVWGILAINLVVVIIMLMVMLISKNKRLNKVLKSFPNQLITIEALLAINLFSRLNRVEVLSMRIFLYLLIIWLAFTYIQIGRAIFKYLKPSPSI